MPSTGPGKAPGLNLALLGGKLAQQFNIFVVNPTDPVSAEKAFPDDPPPLFSDRSLGALVTCWFTCHLLSPLEISPRCARATLYLRNPGIKEIFFYFNLMHSCFP